MTEEQNGKFKVYNDPQRGNVLSASQGNVLLEKTLAIEPTYYIVVKKQPQQEAHHAIIKSGKHPLLTVDGEDVSKEDSSTLLSELITLIELAKMDWNFDPQDADGVRNIVNRAALSTKSKKLR